MKKTIFILLLLLATTQAYSWKPIFVGHRGCRYGVENTREAFLMAKNHYHYDGIECDLMTTKDNQVVICHDGNLDRFGYEGVTIASKTLAELKQMTLTQKRFGNTYTAKIMTVNELCALCDSLDIFPIIEIKGSGGLFKSEMGNFHIVYDAIVNNHLEDKAIILTSYKESIEYIRKNHPSIKCQLLRYNLSEEDYRWCRRWGVEPSMSNSSSNDPSKRELCQELVKRCHDDHINMGIWVVDWDNVYEQQCGWGCYMCTTDSLTPSRLPELKDVNWDNICPFAMTFSELYVTDYEQKAPTNITPSETITFILDEHKLELSAAGETGKGGWMITDISCTRNPKIYTKNAFLSETITQKFAYEQVDSSTVNVFEYNGTTQVAAWTVSTLVPKYPAKSLALSQTEVTMHVGDTITINAIVDPDSCTSDMHWSINQARRILLERDGYSVKVIAKSVVAEAILTAQIDEFEANCTIHVVDGSSIENTSKSAPKTSKKFIKDGNIFIRTQEGIYDTKGNRHEI